MKRSDLASWNGGLREGNASLSTESRALNGLHLHVLQTAYGEGRALMAPLLVPTLAVIGAIAARNTRSSFERRHAARCDPAARRRLRETAQPPGVMSGCRCDPRVRPPSIPRDSAPVGLLLHSRASPLPVGRSKRSRGMSGPSPRPIG